MHICMYSSMCLCGCLCVHSLTVELSTIICIPPCPTPPPTGNTNTHTYIQTVIHISVCLALRLLFNHIVFEMCNFIRCLTQNALVEFCFFCVVVVLAVVVDLCLSSITSQHVAVVCESYIQTYKMFIHTHYIVLYKRRQSYFKANISAIFSHSATAFANNSNLSDMHVHIYRNFLGNIQKVNMARNIICYLPCMFVYFYIQSICSLYNFKR